MAASGLVLRAGVGPEATIATFILFGLSVSAIAAMSPTPISGTGSFAQSVSGTGSSNVGGDLYDSGYSYDQSVDYDSGGPDGVLGGGSSAGSISGAGRV